MEKTHKGFIVCSVCGEQEKRRGYVHRYCRKCSTNTRREQSRRYYKEQKESNPEKILKDGGFVSCAVCGKREERRAAAHKYCRECGIKQKRKMKSEIHHRWVVKNRERAREICNKYKRKHYRENKEQCNQYMKDYYRKKRMIVMKHYGGDPPICACCGEAHYEFLALDHINGGGNKQKKSLKCSIFYWILNNDFPGGFRILCHNCNSALGFHGYCPHDKEKADAI